MSTGKVGINPSFPEKYEARKERLPYDDLFERGG